MEEKLTDGEPRGAATAVRSSRRAPGPRLPQVREVLLMLLPPVAMVAALSLHEALPNIYPDDYVPVTYAPFLVICLAAYGACFVVACFVPRFRKRFGHYSGLLTVAFLVLEVLDIATLKTGYLRLPFMPSPDKVFYSVTSNVPELLNDFYSSMLLLFTGIVIGAVTGMVSGVLIGWSRICNYWFAPFMKIIGPVPSAAWLPVVMVVFPTSHAASVFLIALAVWFPLTLMVSSSIRSTDKRLIESARVLGASEPYVMFHVAIPAALPSVFTGMFMGLSSSFGALIVAEMLGVKAGLGWYITWASSWAEFAKVYSTVAIFIVIFFTLIELLFKVRDHVMKWQEGTVRW